ncbi:MAG: hypothetical protein QOH81_2508 [Sphingomonadales bacterium]|jgi:hypothetical protein|nr:hypothetical protein [Sphingomonadales bacterium]
MSDYDRDPERMRHTDRTTIIHETRDRGGGSGVLIAIILLLVLLAGLFFLFRGSFTQGARDGNVNVAAPNLKLPDINVTVPEVKVPDVKVPEVKVNVPKIDIRTEDGGQANKAAGK